MDTYIKKNDNEYAEETKTSWRKTAFLPTDEQKEDRPSGASAPDERTLREKQLDLYLEQLSDEEKSPYTIAKYRRDARQFLDFSEGKEFSRETSKKYKAWLQEKHYRMNSVNSMLAAMNGFLRFQGREDCTVHPLRIQNKVYTTAEEELTEEEYRCLIKAAGEDEQARLLIFTLGSTGIRVSELKYFTIEAVQNGEVEIQCKNKNRVILLPRSLVEKLQDYSRRYAIKNGPVFRNTAGQSLSRNNIWKKLKRLSAKAGISPAKVYPHNFRKLFARMFYKEEKDLAMLADVLGHSSLNTTRIYIKTTGQAHLERIEKLHLAEAE
ncbi:MAG: tyrosine-type recombinase/integrase [Lachnospiraceae bacterium]|nr:tyrosine-type recombinase/integrase [Lachnospiraceae bacterium]